MTSIHSLGGHAAIAEQASNFEAPVSILGREHVQLLALTTIVKKHSSTVPAQYECDYCGLGGQEIDCTYPCDTLRLLAMPYIGREGFDPAWAVHPDYFDRKPLSHGESLLEELEAYLAGNVQSADGHQLGQSLKEMQEGKWTEL